MNKTVSTLLAGLKKDNRDFRHVGFRMSRAEWQELRSYAHVHYLNYSDVLRAALALLLTTPHSPTDFEHEQA